MDNNMQDYLTMVAIQTKIENFKEFGKTKEETAEAIQKNFSLSYDDAKTFIKRYWDNEQYGMVGSSDASLEEKRQNLIRKKEKIVQEYDLAIQVVEDAINGFSIDKIAAQKGISKDKVKEILQ